ncbi:lytic transglycosylase domain-containing protein [Paenibacillus senegalensis]|uniref:lytic transglycosylase domain-containing protein n=1 Tax=Paenibacillus senegalensis TaxID=1465766 RepID=UPI0002891D01|nr:lytic transglycosylase domain-containing protein [Paenibacillus senegalensis]
MIRIRKRRVLLLILPMMLVLLMLFYNSQWLGKWMYPIKYRAQIDKYSIQNEIDPMLVAAMIRVESKFDPDAESRKGAIGLMQLMPETADWILQRDGFSTLQAVDLRDPDLNIKAGTLYLNFLYDYFQGNRFEVIAAYNAGQGNVMKWREAGIWDGTLQDVDRIPFKETRNYVTSVDYYYKKYMEIYAKGR